MEYPVGQVAGFAGVTVRTLHHYDGIGLLSPSGRSRAGHRRYDDGDLDRLQQILFYRELGFPLDEIAVLLDDPGADPQEHLRRQHRLLSDRIAELRRMAAAVETAMEARKMGINLTPEEKFEVFGDKDPEEHAEEAERRWGGTDAYAESQRRAAGYTKDDWKRIQAEVAEWSAAYDALMEAGEPPPVSGRWTWPRPTGCTSAGGSTSAPQSSTGGSPRCMCPTRGSARSTSRCGRAWPSICGTR